MSVFLSLCSSGCFGVADFFAGVAGRKGSSSGALLISQPLTLVGAIVGLAILPGANHLTIQSLFWGGLSGIGEGVGMVALYRGLTLGRISVVAPVVALFTAGIPVVVGFAIGNHFALPVIIGVGLAIPAVVLVSRSQDDGSHQYSGLIEGVVAGVGFGLFLTLIDRAGTGSGTWSLVACQVIATLIIGTYCFRSGEALRTKWLAVAIAVLAGSLTGAATIFYLASTGLGQLAVVAVLASLGPAITVVMARVFLGERWGRVQVVGLLAAAVAVALISI